jgi:hypothetical protein
MMTVFVPKLDCEGVDFFFQVMMKILHCHPVDGSLRSVVGRQRGSLKSPLVDTR